MMKTGENVREVNRQSDLPLYKQIMDIIQEEIDKKILLPGEQLTPEIELAQHFNVSRMTIRQAINELVRLRVLTRKRGFGTFVLAQRTQRTLRPNIITGFYSDFASQNRKLTSNVVRRRLIEVPEDMADILKVSPGEIVCNILRVRYCDNVPIVIDDSYFPRAMWKHLKDVDLSDCSIFHLIEEKTQRVPMRGTITLRSCAATPFNAKHLGLSVGDPIMFARMVNYDGDDNVMQIGDLYCPETLDLKLPIGRTNNLEE